MLYTEKEKHEIERVKEVFMEHLRQSPDFELLWSDKVGYVCRACRPSGVFLYPRGDRELGGCTFDDRADDALFLLRHV